MSPQVPTNQGSNASAVLTTTTPVPGETPTSTTTPEPTATPEPTTTPAPTTTQDPNQDPSIPASATTSLTPVSTQGVPEVDQGKSSDGLQPGVVAGITIGVALGAALLAVLVTLLVMRSRQHRRRSHHSRRSQHIDKGFAPLNDKEVTDASIANMHRWEAHLPQPLDDNSLRRSFTSLFHQVELHVENFYADRHPTTSLSADLQSVLEHFESDDLPAPVCSLIQQVSKPTAVLKHCLAKCIISNSSLAGTGPSFLPVEGIVLPRTSRGAALDYSMPGMREAYSYWRVLTAYLQSGTTNGNEEEIVLSAKQVSKIQSAATSFSNAFAPWANKPQQISTRIENLKVIMRNAVQLEAVLFSQPSEFQYIWKGGSSKGTQGGQASTDERIVVTPGLMKITDDRAQLLERGFVIVPPVTSDI